MLAQGLDVTYETQEPNMAQKANLIKTNFSSGVVSPLAFGRTDVTRNQNGAAEIVNMIVQPQGSLTRRMGTIYAAEVKNSAKITRQIPFQYSDSISFIIELSDHFIRFISDHELVMDGGIPLTIASPYDETELAEIDYCQSGDVIYLTHPTKAPRTLAHYSATNWVLSGAVHQDGPYRATSFDDSDIMLKLRSIVNKARITSTDNDFSAGDIGKFIEYYDNGFLVIGQIVTYVNNSEVTVIPKDNVVDFAAIDKQAVLHYETIPDRVLSSLAIWSSETENCYIKVDNIWRYMTTHKAAPEDVGTYSADVMKADSTQDPVMLSTTGDLSVLRNNIRAVLKASESLFLAGRDEGRHFRMTLGSRNVWGWIDVVNNTKLCEVRLGVAVPLDPRDQRGYLNDATTTIWKLGAWYVNNYPRVVTIHQQRLIFASTPLEPNRVAMSMIDDFVSFAIANKYAEVLDNSGINFSVGTGEINPIRWMQSGPVLLIGTQGEEFQVKSSASSEPLSATNISITQQTSYGGKKSLRPIKIGSATMFIQKHGVTLRAMTYNFDIDSYVSADLSIISEHIIRQNGQAVSMCYQQIPNTILWVMCSNGKLVSFTYERDQEVYAWTEHEIANGFVESICVIPSQSGNLDQVWMIVRRTINGSIKRYHEYLAPEFQVSSSKHGMIYVDSAFRYSGSAVTAITGLDHLEGEEVTILANESIHPPRTVVNGEITLDYPASRVYAGLGFTSYLKTLPLEGGSQNGTSIGKLKKVHRIDILLSNTIGLKYGRLYPSPDNYPLSFIAPQHIMGQSPDLFSGYLELTDDSGFNKDGQFYIVQDQCYPISILALMPIVIVNE